jgi:aldose 1-epimerase
MTVDQHSQSDPPVLPPGWERSADMLIRIANPTNAVAWVCPELGANVVAFAVRTDDGWRHVLHQDGPDALRERPSRFGLPILFPFPGHMAGGRYRWRGVEYAMPMLNPSAPSYTHGFAHQRPWRVTRQDESSLTAVLDTRTDLEPDQRAGYPFDLTLTLEVALAADALSVTLVAENVGQDEAPVGIGLHPYFDPAFFGVDRTELAVRLPGRRRRALTASPPVPTGTSEPVAPGTTIRPVPLGQTMLVAQTDFDETRTARVERATPSGTSLAVDLVMDEGWEDVLLFAPDTGPSISLEPHTGAPGAASLPEGSPDGLRGLAPGRRLQVRASIAAWPATT